MISLRNRDTLAENIVEELDAMSASIRRHFGKEHKPTGLHSDITADSVSLPSGRMGEWVDLKGGYDGTSRFFAVGSAALTIATTDLIFLRYCLLATPLWFNAVCRVQRLQPIRRVKSTCQCRSYTPFHIPARAALGLWLVTVTGATRTVTALVLCGQSMNRLPRLPRAQSLRWANTTTAPSRIVTGKLAPTT